MGKSVKCPRIGCKGVGMPVDTKKKFSLGKSIVGNTVGYALGGPVGGLVGAATGYSGGNYEYTKIDQFIAADNLSITVSITADRAQDLDSYVNASGYLKRNVLKHMCDVISFSTVYMGYDKKEKSKKAIPYRK